MLIFRTISPCQNVFRKWRTPHYAFYCFYHQKPVINSRKFCTTPIKYIRNKWPNSKRAVESLEPHIEGIIVETGNLEATKLLKPFAFTVAFSSASLCAAAIWEFENIHKKRKQFQDWFIERRKYVGKWRHELNKWWNSLTDGEKMFVPICFLNLMAFFAWKVPRFQPAMVKYFCSNPAARSVCWPMVFSTFSHYSTLHIFANMYVLHSFSSGCVANMGKEQFIGFYLAAGAIASFASYLYKVLINRPGLSLGASGAIMGVLGYSCTRFPDLQLSIIFLPFITFKASAAIKCIMALDGLGVLLGWKFFDHAAHLGGALFGVFWAAYGNTYLWQKRGTVVQAWYNIRGPFSKD